MRKAYAAGNSLLRRLARDTEGAVILLFAFALPVMIGVVGLSLDLGRLATLNTELQDLADAAALAGAAELDGSETAIDRATLRAKTLLANDPRFATDEYAGDVHILEPVFTETLDGAPVTDPTRAHFIEVTTVSRFSNNLLMPVLGAAAQSDTAARAVAGAIQVACDVTPLMLCNPNDPADFDPDRGDMFLLKGEGGNVKYGPGTFGLLDPPGYTSSGADLTRRLLASTDPNFCFVNGVSVRTGGVSGPVDQGLNVRFDMYPNGNVDPVLLTFPPAPNVTKGLVYSATGVNCQFSADANAKPLPRDNCFYTGSCPQVGATYQGDGDWTARADEYWNANHAGKTVKPAGYGAPGFTRFDMYLWELGISDETGSPTYANMPSGGVENPRPQCYQKKSGSSAVGGADRRIFHVAVINCNDYVITGNSTPNMRPAKFAKFFLTEPAENGEIHAEFIEMLKPEKDEGILRTIVQLYR
ncbi:MAG: hypothetical protein H3C38_09605 [Rhodospirillales bacterium]|nr:hypothetical protein [Rhodospirillales bacterium]